MASLPTGTGEVHMKVLACLAVAFAIMITAPASNAVDMPKLEGFTSITTTVQAKKSKQSKQAKIDQCLANCREGCWLWWFCEDNCQCECRGKPGKTCFPQ
jgi:hypothetical protein